MKQTRLWAFFCLTMMAVCYGSMTPFAKDAMLAGVPQFTLTGARMWGAAIFFWLFALTKPSMPVPPRDLLAMAGAGFFAIVCDQGLYILGLSYTSPIDAGVITTLVPVFALVLGVLFRGNRPSLMKIAGIALGLAGAVLMVLSSTEAGGRAGTVYGDVLVICAILSFSVYLVFFTDLIARYPSHVLMKWIFLFSALMMTPLTAFVSEPQVLRTVSLSGWLEVGYVIVGGTILAFLFTVEAQKVASAELVAVFNYLQPVVTGILAVMMGLGDITVPKLVATALIFAAVFTVSRSERNRS